MIHSPDEFYKAPPAEFDGEFVWDFLIRAGCFPRGIKPMDIDGSVEMRGNYLRFETKKPGAEIPEPQRQSLEIERFAKDITVTIIYTRGKTIETMEGFTVVFPPCIGKGDTDYGADRLVQIVKRWAGWADGHPSRAYEKYVEDCKEKGRRYY